MILSASWESHGQDESRLTNLFQGLSRIMLSLGKIPLPHIGSFTMDNNGVVRLANRPLTLQIHQRTRVFQRTLIEIQPTLRRSPTFSMYYPAMIAI